MVKILHIASFIGNVGDILSNLGVQSFLEEKYGESLDLTRLEIRHFHKNVPSSERLSFDEVLRDASSKFDSVLIGGGGFLDYWVPKSTSGATIEISPDVLNRLGKRLIISSVGAYPHRDVPEENLRLFPKFLESMREAGTSLMFRNDGSLADLRQVFGASLTADLLEAGDHCYLLEGRLRPNKGKRKPYVAVNVAPDQIKMHSKRRGFIETDHFFQSVAHGLLAIAEQRNCDLLFVPHLVGDLRGINQICDNLPDLFVRERVRLLGYGGTETGLPDYVDAYAGADLCVCGRLHANIISLILGRPTLSLGVLDRVAAISSQHSLSCLVEANCGSFADNLVSSAAMADELKPDGSVGRISSEISAFLSTALGASDGSLGDGQ